MATVKPNVVDSSTAKYWSDYYGEYGRLLTRKLKKSIKTAAKAGSEPEITSLAEVRLPSGGMFIEGIANFGKDRRVAFAVDLDSELDVISLDLYPVKGR